MNEMSTTYSYCSSNPAWTKGFKDIMTFILISENLEYKYEQETSAIDKELNFLEK